MSEIGFKTETLAAQKKDGSFKMSKVVVIQQQKRETTDVLKLRNAIKQADKGKRNALTQILVDLLLDPVLNEAVERRIRKITNSEITFHSDGDEIDEMYDFIDTPAFEKTLREVVLTKAFGKTVLETAFTPEYDVYSIPRNNLNTAKKVIVREVSDDDGISYTDDEFLINIGDDNDLGFLTRVAPYVIFKRNGGSDYAEFCELWGQPILAGFYDPDDETGREEMEKSFQARGAGGSLVMSKNGDIKPISGDAKNAVHDAFLDWCDEQILIGVIGQTMTSKDGSSLSQSQVHMETEEEISEADKRFVQRILNTQLLPLLEKRGYPVKDGFFKFVEKDNTTLKEKMEIAEQVDSLTADGVDDEYFYETFGLPKGNKAAERAKAKEQFTTEPDDEEEDEEPDNPEPDPKDEKKRKPAKKAVKAKELSLFEKLKDFFGHAPQ